MIMDGLRIALLLIGIGVSSAQVSTQYLDFDSQGSVRLTTKDTAGNVYVVGSVGGGGVIRAFKISPSGATLYEFNLAMTPPGTFHYASPSAVAVDNAGALYLAGTTGTTFSFPTPESYFPTVHPLLPYVPGDAEVTFVCKIDPTGTQLLFSTLLGGKALQVSPPGVTYAEGIAVDPAGNIYVTGWTTAKDFPITPGAFQTTGPTTGPPQPYSGYFYSLVPSAFVLKIASTLDRIVYSTFLSGQPNTGSRAAFIGVDAAGVATVAGMTGDGSSGNPSHFPNTPGAYGYGTTACCQFVTRLSADGGSLVWSAVGAGGGLFPGSAAGLGSASMFSLDAGGNLLLARQTYPTTSTTPGALQTTAPASYPSVGYLARLSSDGSKLTSTFLGTADVAALTLDPQGNIWVAGSCGSSGLLDFPPAFQPASAFYAEISPNLDRLIQSHLMPGYRAVGIEPAANGAVALFGPFGTLQLLPPGFEQQTDVLDVSNSAAAVYWTYSIPPGPYPGAATGPAGWQYVSPGAFLSIYGRNLGPSTALNATFDSAGHIATSLGGITVTFDGTPAPLLYASASQINAIVPFEIAGQSSTVMRVRTATGFSQSVTLPVIPATPYIVSTGKFVIDPSSTTPGGPFAAALNQDGTINSETNRAKAGSVVTIFANGAGLYAQPLADGSVVGTQLISPTLPVTVYPTCCLYSNPVPQPVLYAGTAPGLVAGVLQVNFRLGARTTGVDEYILGVGGSYSQPINVYTEQ
jgi:uncharacterized protein (TIGR03437 family)